MTYYGLVEKTVTCPYCGELITAVIDCSISQQQYVEDCSVCCRPIVMDVHADEDVVNIEVHQEGE